MQRWLLLRDAPRHTELRKLMNRGFTPAVVENLRHKVEAIVEGLLDNMQGAETIDLIKDFRSWRATSQRSFANDEARPDCASSRGRQKAA